MSDFPTIRIKCDEKFHDKALTEARAVLDRPIGYDAIHMWNSLVALYVRRTKTGVSVRQIIDGRAV